MNENKKLDFLINKLISKLKLKTAKETDKWMITLFYNMPIKDLKNRIDTMPKQWKDMTQEEKHVLEIATIVYNERIDKITR